jgi:hypothetical protein
MKTVQEVAEALGLMDERRVLEDADGLLYQEPDEHRPVQWKWVMPRWSGYQWDVQEVLSALARLDPKTNVICEERIGVE